MYFPYIENQIQLEVYQLLRCNLAHLAIHPKI